MILIIIYKNDFLFKLKMIGVYIMNFLSWLMLLEEDRCCIALLI